MQGKKGKKGKEGPEQKGKDGPEQFKSEHALIKECRNKLNSGRQREDVSGVAVDIFEFTDDNKPKSFKKGYVYRAANEDRISIEKGSGSKNGKINLSNPNKAIDARFWTHDFIEQNKVEKMLIRSFSLKHEALLKPLICARTCSNVISGTNMFNQNLLDWISCQWVHNFSRGPYLFVDEKKMIRYIL